MRQCRNYDFLCPALSGPRPVQATILVVVIIIGARSRPLCAARRRIVHRQGEFRIRTERKINKWKAEVCGVAV